MSLIYWTSTRTSPREIATIQCPHQQQVPSDIHSGYDLLAESQW